MTLGRLRLSVADARGLAEGALRGIGYHNDEARIIADHVIDAAMCGYEYSGLAKILNVFESEHFRLPRRSMKVLRETEVSLAFDGGNNVGMLALFHAAQATIKKTAAHGIALVSVTEQQQPDPKGFVEPEHLRQGERASATLPPHSWSRAKASATQK
jgi:L-2-hydroxycarboxylate dehydrogenase (NAD+)